MSQVRSFVSPPKSAYEILVREQKHIVEYSTSQNGPLTTREYDPSWHIADIKLYGRSLEKDIKAIWETGYTYAFPLSYDSKEEALSAGAELVELHRSRCYSIEES